MTARRLQIVNSAVLGLARRIGNPFEAVPFGFMTVRSLVLSAHIFSCFDHAELERVPPTVFGATPSAPVPSPRMIMHWSGRKPPMPRMPTPRACYDLGKLMLTNSPARIRTSLAPRRRTTRSTPHERTRHSRRHARRRGRLFSRSLGIASHHRGSRGFSPRPQIKRSPHVEPSDRGTRRRRSGASILTKSQVRTPLPQADDSYLASIGLLDHMPASAGRSPKGSVRVICPLESVRHK